MFKAFYKYVTNKCKQVVSFLFDFKNSKIIIIIIAKFTVTFTLSYIFINYSVSFIEFVLILWKQFEFYVLNILLNKDNNNYIYYKLLFKLLVITKFLIYKPLLYIYHTIIAINSIILVTSVFGFNTGFNLFKVIFKTTVMYVFFCEKSKDFFLSLILIHIVTLFLFSMKQINYKTACNLINLIIFLIFCLVIWFLYIEVNFTLNTNCSLHNTFFFIKIINIRLDFLTIVFLITIYIISMFVHFYQHVYLELEPRKDVFLIGLNCFILSMVLLVISANWILFFLAWEMLGVSSFFLIGFFKQKTSAWKSAKKAFFFNKISDFLLLISLCFFLKLNESFFINTNLTNHKHYDIIVICLTLMAFLKSAQFIFYFWLPDSMEAPIPASALIHSATLVSAGIYIVLRFNLFLNQSFIYQLFIQTVICTTMVLASLIASMQTDIKKLLAFSTIANCSFIYFLILIKLNNISLVYFALHGILKSSCFLSAGIIIIMQKHYQDLSKWELNSMYEKLLLLFLSLSVIVLSASPLFFSYNIKSNVTDLYSENAYTYTLIITSLFIYTINSYCYGFKILYLFYSKKTKPVFITTKHVQNTLLPKIILILITYFILILIIIFYLYYKYSFYNTISYNLCILVSILLGSILLLNFISQWTEYLLSISLINLVALLLFLI